MNQSETSADENNFSAQENDVGHESDNDETDNESIDDLPVNADNNLAVNEAVNGEPDAIPSGSSGSLWLHYDTGECAICMGPHEGKSRLNCGHFFCFQCLVEWSRVKWQCPTCRQPFAGFVHQSAGSTQEQMYTPDGLPRLPAPVDTRDRSNMIRVLMNGTWVWFGREWTSIFSYREEELREFMEGLFDPEIENQPRTNVGYRVFFQEYFSFLQRPRTESTEDRNDEPNPNDSSEDLN